eukprot:6900471-Prymnesium_polylepis.2
MKSQPSSNSSSVASRQVSCRQAAKARHQRNTEMSSVLRVLVLSPRQFCEMNERRSRRREARRDCCRDESRTTMLLGAADAATSEAARSSAPSKWDRTKWRVWQAPKCRARRQGRWRNCRVSDGDVASGG